MPHSSAERKNSHSIGSAPRRARACVNALEATVRVPSGAGRAISNWRATCVIGRFLINAIPSTNQTTRSAGKRRCRMLAALVDSNPSSIHVGSKCARSVANNFGVNCEVNSSASVNVSWAGVTIPSG